MNEAKAETIRRLGLYFGPLILGSAAAQELYSAACADVAGTQFAGGSQPIVLTIFFLVALSLVAWRLREPVGRAAFAVLAAQHLLLAYAALAGGGPNRVLVNVLMIVAAMLMTVSGARSAPKSRRLVAAAVFVAMFVAALGTRSYANILLGNSSVLGSSAICP
jgi:hypothetical protein